MAFSIFIRNKLLLQIASIQINFVFGFKRCFAYLELSLSFTVAHTYTMNWLFNCDTVTDENNNKNEMKQKKYILSMANALSTIKVSGCEFIMMFDKCQIKCLCCRPVLLFCCCSRLWMKSNNKLNDNRWKSPM